VIVASDVSRYTEDTGGIWPEFDLVTVEEKAILFVSATVYDLCPLLWDSSSTHA